MFFVIEIVVLFPWGELQLVGGTGQEAACRVWHEDERRLDRVGTNPVEGARRRKGGQPSDGSRRGAARKVLPSTMPYRPPASVQVFSTEVRASNLSSSSR